ncbi:MAG: hypothetical protein J5623_06310 [Clostridiales bacterium]|nr:hypothetical protein [Clostridiales bacterium]
MVEVLIAFTLLSIILLMFSQGIAFATKAEANATDNRNAADQAMASLQQKLAEGTDKGIQVSPDVTIGSKTIVPYVYTENDYTYVVYRVEG